ncbi:MAG: hypothetical protein KDB18_04175 [Salinibacterium sp.]|nr:hypothetical protein [Salinibacterium sp.]
MIMLMEHRDDRTDRVTLAAACPNCGERIVDKLIWTDDDTVRCETCGTEYVPFTKPTGGA